MIVDKLKVYRDELIAEIEAVKNTDNTAEIEEKVNEYRAHLIAEINAKKDEKLAKLNSDVDCLNGIIAKEEAIAEAATIEAVVGEPAVSETIE